MPNYKLGALKRKLGIKPGKLKPGDLLSKMNEQKLKKANLDLIKPVEKKYTKLTQKETLAFKGLV